MSLRFIPPCSPIAAKKVPAGEAWVHEVKLDGYRVQLHKNGRDVAIYSRNGHGFTDRFAAIQLLLLPWEKAGVKREPQFREWT